MRMSCCLETGAVGSSNGARRAMQLSNSRPVLSCLPSQNRWPQTRHSWPLHSKVHLITASTVQCCSSNGGQQGDACEPSDPHSCQPCPQTQFLSSQSMKTWKHWSSVKNFNCCYVPCSSCAAPERGCADSSTHAVYFDTGEIYCLTFTRWEGAGMRASSGRHHFLGTAQVSHGCLCTATST